MNPRGKVDGLREKINKILDSHGEYVEVSPVLKIRKYGEKGYLQVVNESGLGASNPDFPLTMGPKDFRVLGELFLGWDKYLVSTPKSEDEK